MSKRAFIRDILRKTGALELRWRTLGPHLYCFNYHRIGDPTLSAFDRGVFSCSGERFREHIRLLQERFEIVDIARLSYTLKKRATPRRPIALITFDDGYIDNYELAFPILKEFRVTAAFFIPTGFIGGSRLPWWDEIAWSLRNASTDRVSLAGCKEELDLAPTVIDRTIAAILELVKVRPIPMDEQVAEVREACRPRGSIAAAGAGLFVNEVQIGELRQAGMDIGSHTHTQRILSHLDADAQRDELATSKEILEGLLGEAVNAVAYPVGVRGSYGPETCRIAESVGYHVGFNFIPGVNPLPTERPLDLNRLAVDENAAPTQLKARAAFPWL